MHEALEAIRNATVGTPFEGRLWLVGGAVRDPLLGRPEPQDFDIVTDLDALELASLLWSAGVSAIPPITYPRFGTALVRVGGANVELVTSRRESYDASSRKPSVAPASLKEDAERRDFTVNTLLKNVHTGQIEDPLGVGLEDLRARRLRTPLDPLATFSDDPLRMLRAIRFRWSLGFEPVPGLYDAIRRESERLRIVSGERIRDELVRMLALDDADRCLSDLMETGLLHVFAPEFEAMKGVTQGRFHHLDVWDHTLEVVRNTAGRDVVLKLAALLHDVGKPATRSVDANGDVRFFGHESVGAALASTVLRRLRFPTSIVERVVKLVKNHMRFTGIKTFSDAAARRLLRDLGEDTEALLDLVEADAKALRPGVKTIDLSAVRATIETVRRSAKDIRFECPLTGEEIMEIAHLSPGPEVGHWKRLLIEQVLEGSIEPGDKEGAAAFIRRRLGP